MMAIVNFNSTAPDSDFDHFVDWRYHPTEGELSLIAFSDVTAHYDFGDMAVDIDLTETVWLRQCRGMSFLGDFAKDTSLLLAKSSNNILPIHLSFSRPVSSLGAYVSPNSTSGFSYIRKMGVKLVGQNQWIPLARTAGFSGKFDTACFLGANATAGEKISQVWFDVVNDLGNSQPIKHVAIGNLYFNL
jgi:hypothetical protein